MAYAFNNLMNLADNNKEDKSTAPIPKGSMTPTVGSGVSTGGAGSLQQAQAPVQAPGAMVGRQYEASKPLVQQAVASSQKEIRDIGARGKNEVGEQETAYRAANQWDPQKYAPDVVNKYVETGEGDLASLQAVLSGVGFDAPSFDATPKAAEALSGILTGGGGQYLSRKMGGGTGALEQIAGATAGSEVGQAAVDEATTLGGIAGAREAEASKEVIAARKAAAEKSRADVRSALAAARARLLGEDQDQSAAEEAAYTATGDAEKAKLSEEAYAQAEPELRNLFGDKGTGRVPYEQAIRDAIAASVKRAAGAPTVRSGADVITQSEYDRLSRIGGLTGEAVPGMTDPGRYEGQYALDPAFMEAIRKLIPVTPAAPTGGYQGPVTSNTGGIFDGASPGDGRVPVGGYSGPVEALAPGTVALPGGQAGTPLTTGEKASETAKQIMSSGWAEPDPMSILTGGHNSLGIWF